MNRTYSHSPSYSPFAPKMFSPYESKDPHRRHSASFSPVKTLTKFFKDESHVTKFKVFKVVVLLLAVFFSWALSVANKLSEDEITSSYPTMAKVIIFSGTSTGKVMLAFLWVVFACCLGVYLKFHQ